MVPSFAGDGCGATCSVEIMLFAESRQPWPQSVLPFAVWRSPPTRTPATPRTTRPWAGCPGPEDRAGARTEGPGRAVRPVLRLPVGDRDREEAGLLEGPVRDRRGPRAPPARGAGRGRSVRRRHAVGPGALHGRPGGLAIHAAAPVPARPGSGPDGGSSRVAVPAPARAPVALVPPGGRDGGAGVRVTRPTPARSTRGRRTRRPPHPQPGPQRPDRPQRGHPPSPGCRGPPRRRRPGEPPRPGPTPGPLSLGVRPTPRSPEAEGATRGAVAPRPLLSWSPGAGPAARRPDTRRTPRADAGPRCAGAGSSARARRPGPPPAAPRTPCRTGRPRRWRSPTSAAR